MTEVFRLCDDYLTRWAALDPVAAGMVGLSEAFGAATDYGPDGYAAREELIATTLAALPAMFAGWRASLNAGLDRGLTAARRQAVEAAAAADRYAGTHDALVAAYGDGPLSGELATAAEQAHGAYREMARYLREDYAPRAAERDAVGAERYAVAARISLGADIDLAEAYEWGWAELARIEAEMAIEADK